MKRAVILKRRIDAASKFVLLEQLCLSPQCGFSSTLERNDVTFDDEIAKLRLVDGMLQAAARHLNGLPCPRIYALANASRADCSRNFIAAR